MKFLLNTHQSTPPKAPLRLLDELRYCIKALKEEQARCQKNASQAFRKTCFVAAVDMLAVTYWCYQLFSDDSPIHAKYQLQQNKLRSIHISHQKIIRERYDFGTCMYWQDNAVQSNMARPSLFTRKSIPRTCVFFQKNNHPISYCQEKIDSLCSEYENAQVEQHNAYVKSTLPIHILLILSTVFIFGYWLFKLFDLADSKTISFEELEPSDDIKKRVFSLIQRLNIDTYYRMPVDQYIAKLEKAESKIRSRLIFLQAIDNTIELSDGIPEEIKEIILGDAGLLFMKR